MVATGCPACMLQITDLLSQAGGKVRVKHVLELYAEALEELADKPAQAQAGFKWSTGALACADNAVRIFGQIKCRVGTAHH